ncbi:MAG: hypothetical protein ACREFB_10370, partial [Stellaceae bacterium]
DLLRASHAKARVRRDFVQKPRADLRLCDAGSDQIGQVNPRLKVIAAHNANAVHRIEFAENADDFHD